MQNTNPNAKDHSEVAPADMADHLKRRFHIRLNHMDTRETVIIQ